MAVSAKNFKFISPQIHIEEIDKSQIPAAIEAVGPIVIGRAARGPAFTPVRVESFSDFVNTFGNPVPGGNGGDVWREGNYTSPMYGTYGIQSWLKNGETATYIRLLGVHSDNKTTAGVAGWKVGEGYDGGATGGAYGLFVWPSASSDYTVTGAIAAVWYLETGSVRLQGKTVGPGATSAGGVIAVTSASYMLHDDGSTSENPVFTVSFVEGVGLPSGTFSFGFDKGKSNYIRKVFNTDPTLLGRKDVDSGEVKYFLGESYENTFKDKLYTSETNNVAALAQLAREKGESTYSGSVYYGAIMGLSTGSAVQHDVRRGALANSTYAKSGWFFSQDLSANTASWSLDMTENITSGRVKKLFRFVGLDAGEWTQNNLKISLTNIRASSNEDVEPYASFTVRIRTLRDSDDNAKIVESFEGCNLNPNSNNYLLRKIGTKYVAYDETAGRTYEKGEFENRSKYIRVEVDPEFETGFPADYVPYGVTGPTKFADQSFNRDALKHGMGGAATGTWGHTNGYAFPGSSFLGEYKGMNRILSGAQYPMGVKIEFPEVPIRTTTSTVDNFKLAYWGAQTTADGTDNFKEDIRDLVRVKPDNVSNPHTADGTVLKYQFAVSLDNVIINGALPHGDLTNLAASASVLAYATASRNLGYSLSATGSVPSNFNAGTSNGYKTILDVGAGNLTTVFFGATDGFDITNSDPLANSNIGTSATKETSYEYMSYYRAIETIKNPEIVSYNVAAIPGLENESLTNLLIDNTQERGDALAIIDVPNSYVPPHEYLYDSSKSLSFGSVVSAVQTVKDRKYNTSYGSAYYPWVKIRDGIAGKDLWSPPSVAALGAMAYTDRLQAPWFAPAGFNRGGLSSGVAGVPVVATALKLFKSDRDDLYEVNVNPIANFPNEGIVVFGQKTLQVERTALDRINVRRLMIYLKRGISQISSRVLFEPNVPNTWNNFKSQAIPFLDDVKSRFGLTDYKLILDETTTTPDLIDQNILYAKLFLKPARAIEFIALDFIITNTGASFED